jgi:hypothetical protein
MKKAFTILIIVTLTFSETLFAQINFKNINPNQFELSLYNGVCFSQIIPEYGNEQLIHSPALNHNLMLTYNRYFNEQISLSAEWGFGFGGFLYNVPAHSISSGTENWQYWHKVNYNIYHQFGIKANYHLQLSRKDRLRFGIGGGIMQYLSTGLSVSGSNEIDGNEYIVEIDYPKIINPIAILSLDYIKPLKNKNEFQVGIKYTHGFMNVYSGEYSLYSYSSGGKIYSRGSNAGIKVAYIFTGNAIKEKLNKRVNSGEDYNKAKSEIRKERRYLPSESTFLNIYIGTRLSKNSVNDPDGYIHGGTGILEKHMGLEYEKGLKNNWFVSGGYHYGDYTSSARTIYSFMDYPNKRIETHEFNLGGGYRWITASNFKILNLYSGVNLGFTEAINNENNIRQYGITHFYEGTEVENLNFQVTTLSQHVSRFVAAIYLGAAKDFRITDFFWISLNYRFQQGLNSLVQNEISYNSTLFAGTKYATSKLNGTAHQISIGLKLRFR